MENKIDPEIDVRQLNKLFDVMKYMCDLSCGDGDAFLVSGKYLELANMFESYMKNKEDEHWGVWGYARYETETSVSFSSGMDTIAFCKDESGLPSYNGKIFGDFIVKIVDGLIQENYELLLGLAYFDELCFLSAG